MPAEAPTPKQLGVMHTALSVDTFPREYPGPGKPLDRDDARTLLSLPVLRPTIRQSSVKNLFLCRRKFLWENRMDLVRKSYKAAPFIGTIFHLIHGYRFEGKDTFQVASSIQKEVEKARDLAGDFARETGSMERIEETLRGMEADVRLAIEMSQLHWDEFPLDSELYEPVVVEKEYSIKLPGFSIPIEGRIDLVLRLKRPGGGLIILDHKTTSKSPMMFRKTLGFAIQPKIYRLLLEKSGDFPGEQVLGAVHNVVQRPYCKWKPGQDFDEYIEEVRAWYRGEDDTRGELDETGTPVRFKSGPRKGLVKPRWEWASNKGKFEGDPPLRSFFTRFDEPVLSDGLLKILHETAKASTCAPTLSNFWTTGELTGACESLFGSECPYLELCRAEPSEYPEVIKRGWTQKSASPACVSPADKL